MDKKSLLMVALGAILSAALFASLIMFQILVPAQPAQIPKQSQASSPLQKFKVDSNLETAEAYFLVADGGKELRIWASNGLDPEFILVRAKRPLLT